MTRILLRIVVVIAFGCGCFVLLALAVGQAIDLGDNQLVFNGFLDKKQTDIYVMDLAHSLAIRLTNSRASEAAPVWSPDGQQIAYVTGYVNEHAGSTSVILINFQNHTVRQVSESITNEGCPQWSHDGRYLAFGKVPYLGGLPEINILDLQSGYVQRITDYPRSASFPTSSPDGRYIAFTSGAKDPERYEIRMVDLHTGEVRPLVPTTGGFFPSWSPDGRYIVFKTIDWNAHIYLWDVLEGRLIMLYEPAETYFQTFSWSSDSQSIIYNALSGTFRLEIAACIQNPTTCSPQLLTPEIGAYHDPHWRPRQP